ncbi:acetylserotonin O-methyltransferase [Planotetraspora sp. A-T 1434]|uniref:acetylserotonin O-methyltransferase n=1 Tax=Planotetraspora sp. A-T 1434 TaxID=2979219 RepID=UPI0021C0CA85|nr:acetylserotonin O-methyltransferase [Planotetraspora sp. A-T 1434]MCT9933155.1 acetylserotonin O-methyltransferase [Planotetraspora sp. A-T 1434]
MPPRIDIQAITELTELADYIVPFTLRVVCDLGVADHLATGPRTAGELAAAVGAHPGALTRALRALSSRGIFAETDPGVFTLTPLAEPLRTGHPLSLRAAYPLLPADIHALGQLTTALRTGRPAYGAAYWDHLAADPAQSLAVDRWMAGLNGIHLRTVMPAYDWSAVTTVVDVGGGNGAFLAGLLARFPGLRGVLFDLPHVVRHAVDGGDRLQVVAGSFFDTVPPGGDLYVLKTVLPGWDDEHAERILRNVRTAGARVLLLEAVIAQGDGSDVAKLVDVHTLAVTGGRHRDSAELADLLDRAGFRLTRITPTATLTLVEGEPV